MAKSKAAGINALMQWMTGNVRGMNPDQMLNFLRQFPDVENMTVADLQRALAQIQPPASAPRPRSQSPADVNERVAGNPATGLRPDGNIRAALQELDPEFYARIDSATPDEITEAYRNAVNRASRVRSGRPRKNATAKPAGDPDGNAVRELLPGVPVGGVRGPGVPVSGPTGLIPAPLLGLPDNSPRGLIPAPLRGLPDPGQRGLAVVGERALRPVDDAIDVPFERMSDPIPLRSPRRQGLPDGRPSTTDPNSPDYMPDVNGAGVNEGSWTGWESDPIPLRSPRRTGLPDARPLPPDGPPRQMPEADGPQPGMARAADAVDDSADFWKKAAAGAAAVGGVIAAPFLLPRQGTTPPASGSTTADLVDETRPAPRVEATPDVPQPTVTQGTPDYSAQARQLIAQANEIQRREGRQTPESLALIRRADELYAQAAEGRRAGTQPPIMPAEQQNAQTSAIQRDARQTIEQNQGSSYRAQARRMMAELNMRSSQGSISQAEYSAMKSRIDELFRLADQEDNAPRNIPGRGRLPGAPTGGPQMLRPTGGYQRRPTPSTT